MPIKPCAEKTVLDTVTSYIDFLPVVFSVLNSKLSGQLCKTSCCTGCGGNQIRFYIVFQRQNLDFCICFITGCILEAQSFCESEGHMSSEAEKARGTLTDHSRRWRAERVSSKVRDETRISTLITFIQHSHGTQRRKGLQTGNEVEPSLFAMI